MSASSGRVRSLGSSTKGDPCERPVSTCVVVAASGYSYLVLTELVNEPVLIGDAPRPVAVKPTFEGLGFTDPLIAVPFEILDQRVDPSQDLAVLGLPPHVIIPGALVPHE